MAVRDHSLDEKIVEAARIEFTRHGFRQASLRKIAERAGITTGALYTRYKNKDVLFSSLVAEAMQEMGRHFEPMRESYMAVKACPDSDSLMAAIRQEEQIYLDLLFRYYEECVLFFCRSDGSALQASLHQMMQHKAQETVAFLKAIAKRDFDADGIAFLIAEQFHYYRQILDKGYSKEKALSCMKTVEEFLEAGWRDLFQKIL